MTDLEFFESLTAPDGECRDEIKKMLSLLSRQS